MASFQELKRKAFEQHKAEQAAKAAKEAEAKKQEGTEPGSSPPTSSVAAKPSSPSPNPYQKWLNQGIKQDDIDKIKSYPGFNTNDKVMELLDYHLHKPSEENIKTLQQEVGEVLPQAPVSRETAINLLKLKKSKNLASEYYLRQHFDGYPFNESPYKKMKSRIFGEDEPAGPRNPYVGLINCGNSCFINSTVQMLYHIPEFKAMILSNTSSDVPFSSLRNIFTRIQEEENAAAAENRNTRPQDIRDLLSYEFECILAKIGKEKSNYGRVRRDQEDVEEFLRECILDKIKVMGGDVSYLYHTREENKLGYYTEGSIVTGDYTFKARGTAKPDQNVRNLGIENTFRKMKLSFRSEPDFTFGVDFDISDTSTSLELQNLIEHATKSENAELEYLGQFLPAAGENIKNPTGYVDPILKVQEYKPIPDPSTSYIMIQIKRFNNTGAKKVNPIKINKIIKLTNTYFECVGVVFHSGATMKSGHYVYNWWNGSNWILFNDNNVSVEEGADDSPFLPVRFDENSYVLLYKKREMPEEEYAIYSAEAKRVFETIPTSSKFPPPSVEGYREQYRLLLENADKEEAVILSRQIARLEQEVKMLTNESFNVSTNARKIDLDLKKARLQHLFDTKGTKFKQEVKRIAFQFSTEAGLGKDGRIAGKLDVFKRLLEQYKEKDKLPEAEQKRLLAKLSKYTRNSDLARTQQNALQKDLDAIQKANVVAESTTSAAVNLPKVVAESAPPTAENLPKSTDIKPLTNYVEELAKSYYDEYIKKASAPGMKKGDWLTFINDIIDKIMEKNDGKNDRLTPANILFEIAKLIQKNNRDKKIARSPPQKEFIEYICQTLHEIDKRTGTTFYIYRLIKDGYIPAHNIMGRKTIIGSIPGFLKNYNDSQYQANGERKQELNKTAAPSSGEGGRRVTRRKPKLKRKYTRKH